MAKLVGKPRAWRAVGNILNKNKNPKIPCHRIIRANEKIGGYRKGVKKNTIIEKRGGLLREEGMLKKTGGP